MKMKDKKGLNRVIGNVKRVCKKNGHKFPLKE